MSEYKWRDSRGRFSVDAQVAGEELERIRIRDGVVKTAVVVDEARPKDSSLHPAFTWNNKAAGEKWRHHEARNLIRSVRVIIEDDGETSDEPMLVHVSRGEDGPHYQSPMIVAENIDQYSVALTEALSRVTQAETAVRELERAAMGTKDGDRLARINVALESLRVAHAAVLEH